MTSATNKTLIGFVILLVLGLVAWAVLTAPDQRSTVGDAVDALPRGVDDAAQELGDRTPGERLGNAVEDAGEAIKERSNSK